MEYPVWKSVYKTLFCAPAGRVSVGLASFSVYKTLLSAIVSFSVYKTLLGAVTNGKLLSNTE